MSSVRRNGKWLGPDSAEWLTSDMPMVQSVNIGSAQPNPWKSVPTTGFHKRPVPGPVHVRVPGPAGSGLDGDHVGDHRNHGGEEQAVLAHAAEDLARWSRLLGRDLPPGAFGENLTTVGLDLTEAPIGQRWLVGDELVLEVSSPRVPCATFAGKIAEARWIKRFVEHARPGAYLRVITPGPVRAGDPVRIVAQPDGGPTIVDEFREFFRPR
ncbi:6-N-hydroxylaminopurine resistance protein [Amycolatopsis sp. YIM 10]|nr:6-N-hydroxylaminopurine resistance protein [Amycolatopsis sp. YIM 10]